MLKQTDWQEIAGQIADAINQPFNINNIETVSGGCINQAYILHAESASFFVKFNQAALTAMFQAEYAGLQEMVESQTVKVPAPVCCGTYLNHAFIALEYLPLTSKNIQADALLGRQMAALHQIQKPYYGWSIDNTIGSTEQINTSHQQWSEFWRDERLLFQLQLAEANGYTGKLIQRGEQLAESLDCFFSRYSPHPSLLHGDLWAGNAAMTKDGIPVIFDPACYYGDRETDLAMTELFSGFGGHFYAAYQEVYPLDQDYQHRKTLYNLYHILNHLNLFGSSYQQQAQGMIDSLLAEIS